MSDKPQTTRQKDGLQIPEFQSAKQILSKNRLNRLVRRLNAITNMRAAASNQPGPLMIADGVNSLLPVSGIGSSDSPSGSAQVFSFRLKAIYDEYVTGHKITASFGAGIVEDTSTDYHIAKPGKLRTNLSSEVKFGDTHSYSYGAGPDSWNKQRTDSWSGGTENQLVAPPWTEDDEIWAIAAQTILFDGADTPISWVMVGPWRQWAKIAS